ncbi:hypothetical protein BBJ28_00025113, partial [Nothophytophthora sp. Chile5]
MPADSYAEKLEHGYTDLEAHESINGHHLVPVHNVPVENVPYMVKSQFAKEMMAEFVATFVTMLFGLACMTQVVLSAEASGS